MSRPVRLTNVVLSEALRQELDELIAEYRRAGELEAAGFPIRRRLLLEGPPGCGKTLTAEALANELGLPFFIVRFDALIGSYLGQTAGNLRQLFRYAETNRCVLLFDELDAIGRTRGRASDVGELDRIVIALMQELELSQIKGLLVATSNVPEHLDKALIRRFDATIRYPKPTRLAITKFAKSLLARHNAKPTQALLMRLSITTNYAQAESVTLNHLRHEFLSGRLTDAKRH
jgi:SpoVK/Ycf46/Vps4 family AAA+-type ATPase